MTDKCNTCGKKPVEGCSNIDCSSRKSLTADITEKEKKIRIGIPERFYEEFSKNFDEPEKDFK